MPIYEYQCGACRHRLEKLQRLSDPPLTDCPVCGAEALTKLVSAAAFRLKGGGWYETDFKSGGQRNLAGDGPSKPDTGGAAADGTAAGPKETSQPDKGGTSDGPARDKPGSAAVTPA